MAKARSEVVRDLIEEERYDEARKILKRINNPTAKKLLEELDELDPERKGHPGLILVAALSLVLVLVLVAAAVLLSRQAQGSSADGQSEIIIPTLMPLPHTPDPVTAAVQAAATAEVSEAFASPSTVMMTATVVTNPTIVTNPTVVTNPTIVPSATLLAPTQTATATRLVDIEALRRSLYTFCMRKGDDPLCSAIADLPSLQQDPNVIGCFEQFGTSLDDFGNCIRPQYAGVYDAAWKRIYPATVVPQLCTANPKLFGVPEGNTMVSVCTQHSKDMVSRNPYYIVDSCFETYLAWNKVFQLAPEAIEKRVTNFALCVWQRQPLPDN